MNPEGAPVLAPWNFPHVALVENDGHVLVAYPGRTAVRESPLYVRTLDSTAGEWGEAERISPEGVEVNMAPSLRLDRKGEIHCVWLGRAGRNRPYEVWYSRRSDESGSWTEPTVLASGLDANPPKLAADGEGTLYLLFWNRPSRRQWTRIYLHVSEDGGRTWRETDPNFPRELRKGHSTEPQLQLGPQGEVLLVWLDSTPGARLPVFNRSSDRGRTWLSEPVSVEPRTDFNASSARFLVKGTSIFVVWTVQLRGEIGFQTQLWASAGEELGIAWSKPTKVYESNVSQVTVKLYTDGARLGLVWTEQDRQNAGALKTLLVDLGADTLEAVQPHLLKRLLKGSTFRSFDVGRSEFSLTVAAAYSGWGMPGEVTIMRDRRHGGELKAKRLTAEGPQQEIVGPRFFPGLEGNLYLLVHQVRRRQFPMEPLRWESELILHELNSSTSPD